MTETRFFDFAALSGREQYKLLIGAVVPRPIALVTTVDRNGRRNAAPISFFNCLSADPAILAIGVENHADATFKDTAWNIRTTGVFTVNIVDMAMMDAMNVCAVPFAPEVDELEMAGLAAIAGTRITAPRIASSPAAFECRRHTTLAVSGAREIILGEVVAAHLRADIVNDRLHVDPVGLDAVGRMGGQGYATTRDLFDLPTMTVPEWESRSRDKDGAPGAGRN